jgi:hypothetical protein
MTLCSADYHQRVRHVECVASLGQLHCRDGICCSHIPILDPTQSMKIKSSTRGVNGGHLDGLVPRASSKDAALGCLKPFDDSDRRVMLRNLLSLSSLDVEETRGIITTAGNDLISLLLKCGWKKPTWV